MDFSKKQIIVLSIIIALILAIGTVGVVFSVRYLTVKTYNKEEMSITLPIRIFDETTEDDRDEGYIVVFNGLETTIWVKKIYFDESPEFKDFTTEEYANRIIRTAIFMPVFAKNMGEYASFQVSFEDPETLEEFVQQTYVFKSDDGIWVFSAVSPAELSNSYYKKVDRWMQSVEFE